MKHLCLLLLLAYSAFCARLEEKIWKNNATFLTFLEANNIPQKLYFNLESSDQELCSEIKAGIKYYILEDEKTKETLQILIPISEELQLHLYKKNGEFVFTTTPVSFEEITQTIAIPVSYSPYQDLLDATSNKALANEFIRSFGKLVNFKKMQKGNNVAIKYTQRIRLGKYYGTPVIHAALIEVNKKTTSIFRSKTDGLYYDKNGKNIANFFMKTPVSYTRISSRFSLKRWHPVLKRYRAHLGIDYAAPTGRAIIAAAAGRVIYKGWKGGYGKTIEIQHEGGYKSLYAHMSRYSNVKKGKWVKQGTVIGYVGSTGVSTGPHLHFGLYKNGKAINPANVIRVTKSALKGNDKKEFLSYSKQLSQELLYTIENGSEPLKLDNFKENNNKIKQPNNNEKVSS